MLLDIFLARPHDLDWTVNVFSNFDCANDTIDLEPPAKSTADTNITPVVTRSELMAPPVLRSGRHHDTGASINANLTAHPTPSGQGLRPRGGIPAFRPLRAHFGHCGRRYRSCSGADSVFRCTFCSPRLRSKHRLVMLAGRGRQIEPGE
jgi:hypothetical protein